MPSVIAARSDLRYSEDHDSGDGEKVMKRLAGALAVLVVFTLLVAVQANAASVLEASRALAENVLGDGQVKSLRAADNDATLLIRWESATYKATNSQATTRELLYAEAILTTNSIIGQLPQVFRIRFTIMQGEHMLGTGQTTRAHGVSLMFSPALGGGTYSVPESKPKPMVPGADGSAAEQ